MSSHPSIQVILITPLKNLSYWKIIHYKKFILMIGNLFDRNGHHKEGYMNIHLVVGIPNDALLIAKKKFL